MFYYYFVLLLSNNKYLSCYVENANLFYKLTVIYAIIIYDLQKS